MSVWRFLVKTEKKVEQKIHDAGVDAAVHVVEDVAHEVGDAVVTAERRLFKLTRDFLHLEASGGILLMMAAFVALAVANSPLYPSYHYFLEDMQFRIGFSDLDQSFDAELGKSILHWINDGMMAVFFFLVGLEVKREFIDGELSSPDRLVLPILAAVGGMAAPAGLFWLVNAGSPETLGGWAIPAATDIAFALGIIALLGRRVPASVKILLLAIAVIDDIGAIVIIALFYTGDLWLPPLFVAVAALLILFVLNRKNVKAKTPYFLASALLWVAVLESGIHATLAGVVAAMFIPMRDNDDPGFSPLKNLEHALHPWVAFGILPLFAFANAGVSLGGLDRADMLNPLSLGIAAGLFFGKQIGVFFMIWIAVVSGISPRPHGATWFQLYAMAVLCGVGFTMSLFIGGLAFDGMAMQSAVRIGVIGGSLLSAVAGYLLLLLSTRTGTEEENFDEQ